MGAANVGLSILPTTDKRVLIGVTIPENIHWDVVKLSRIRSVPFLQGAFFFSALAATYLCLCGPRDSACLKGRPSTPWSGGSALRGKLPSKEAPSRAVRGEYSYSC